MGAILASSCCIVPLVLVLIGVSGAWIGNLTALEPYSGYFSAAAVLFIGAGFWRARRFARTGCPDGSSCTRPQSSIVKIALWAAALLVLVNLSMRWWAPLFY
jgi:mercuric ion transport protein